MSRVKAQIEGVNLYEKSDWSKMSDYLINNLPLFELAFQPEVEKFKKIGW